jgi:hypothetical protein
MYLTIFNLTTKIFLEFFIWINILNTKILSFKTLIKLFFKN